MQVGEDESGRSFQIQFQLEQFQQLFQRHHAGEPVVPSASILVAPVH
jgi:hypothetical protein